MSRLHIAGGEVEYEAVAGGQPTLVFLHEGLGSMRLWRDFPHRLCQMTGAGGIVWSRHGYGGSEVVVTKREPGYMHHEALVVLPELLERLGLDDVVLVGHSDGASIALIFAGGSAVARRAVRGVIAIAPHVFVEAPTVESIAAARVRYESGDLRHRLARHHDDVDAAFYGWNDIWLSPPFRHWSIEEYLPAISCPILLVQAEDDPYGTTEQVDRIERQAGGPVSSLMLGHGGHAPHAAQSGRVLAAAEELYRAVTRR